MAAIADYQASEELDPSRLASERKVSPVNVEADPLRWAALFEASRRAKRRPPLFG